MLYVWFSIKVGWAIRDPNLNTELRGAVVFHCNWYLSHDFLFSSCSLALNLITTDNPMTTATPHTSILLFLLLVSPLCGSTFYLLSPFVRCISVLIITTIYNYVKDIVYTRIYMDYTLCTGGKFLLCNNDMYAHFFSCFGLSNILFFCLPLTSGNNSMYCNAILESTIYISLIIVVVSLIWLLYNRTLYS